MDATEIKIQGGIHLRVMDHDIQLIFHQQSCTKSKSSFFFCTKLLSFIISFIDVDLISKVLIQNKQQIEWAKRLYDSHKWKNVIL